MARKAWITDWRPNNEGFWKTQGKSIARRNLIFSIFAENLGFSVWNLWTSVTIALALGFVSYDFKHGESVATITSQMFLLTALPNLIGATLRLPYGAAVSIFGGRNWTVVSAALLLIPCIFLVVVLSDVHTPFWLICVAAASAGLGGGNFASSMANISHFYPDSKKGWALGLNAAGGNIGVAIVQLVVPAALGAGVLGIALATGQKAAIAAAAKQHIPAAARPEFIGAYLAAHGVHLSLPNAGLFWIPFILLATVCAYLFMDNLAVSKASFREQAGILKRANTWWMSLLYIGTFGSFLGYSAAFGLLITALYPTELALKYAFLGPLVGSIARPFGGMLSDRVGGTAVTFYTFLLMAAAQLGLILAIGQHAPFGLFIALFLALFVLTGVGNGSTYRMIPVLYLKDSLQAAVGEGREALAKADSIGRKEAAAGIAFISAIGAYGGFLIPYAFKTSFTPPLGAKFTPASLAAFQIRAATIGFGLFLTFYVICALVTYARYLRTGHEHAVAKLHVGEMSPKAA